MFIAPARNRRGMRKPQPRPGFARKMVRVDHSRRTALRDTLDSV